MGIVITRRLVPLAEGPSMMFQRLSTIEIEALSCWSRRSLMVVFLFK